MNNKVLIPQKEGCQSSIGRSIESQRISASEKTGSGPQKRQFWKVFLQRRGWRSGVRDTRAL
jgi:hypothetical protein